MRHGIRLKKTYFFSYTTLDNISVDDAVKRLYLTNYDIPPVDHIRDLVKKYPTVATAIFKLRKGKKIRDEIRTKLYLYGIINWFVDSKEIEIKNKIIDASLPDNWLKENVKGILRLNTYLKALESLSCFFFKAGALQHRLKPYFTKYEILDASKNYIPTQFQNIDPAAAQEPARIHAIVVKQKLVPFFIKKVFRERKEEKYYLVLADSGMGKTTFMINLFLKYMKKRFKKYQMALVPLGHPKADEKIESVADKPRTILMLDAFDEDARAGRDYKARMKDIIGKTLDFHFVIITSRTQFFPTDPDIPEETGLYKFGGAKGEHRFSLLYISPFNQKEINRYLRKKYPFFQRLQRRRARAIVEKSPHLMVRPMLLANIQYLLERRKPYKHTFEIYEEMVEKWIQRERVENKVELRKFSEVIARDMYENQQSRGGLFISHDQIGQFAKKHGIKLEELEMRSRSLLNRNAEGKYKFAHKSILEYLLSLELIRDPFFYSTFNFDNMEQTRLFYKEQFHQQYIIPFFSQQLKGEFKLLEESRLIPIENLEKVYVFNASSVAEVRLNLSCTQNPNGIKEIRIIFLFLFLIPLIFIFSQAFFPIPWSATHVHNSHY